MAVYEINILGYIHNVRTTYDYPSYVGTPTLEYWGSRNYYNNVDIGFERDEYFREGGSTFWHYIYHHENRVQLKFLGLTLKKGEKIKSVKLKFYCPSRSTSGGVQTGAFRFGTEVASAYNSTVFSGMNALGGVTHAPTIGFNTINLSILDFEEAIKGGKRPCINISPMNDVGGYNTSIFKISTQLEGDISKRPILIIETDAEPEIVQFPKTLEPPVPEHSEDFSVSVEAESPMRRITYAHFEWSINGVLKRASKIASVGEQGPTTFKTTIKDTLPKTMYKIGDLISVRAKAEDGEGKQTNWSETKTYIVVPTTKTLNISINGRGSVTRNPDEESYLLDTDVTITAIPQAGQYLEKWTGDLTGNNLVETIKMSDNKNITATFKKKPQLTINIEGGGDVTITPKKEYYDVGEIVTIRAVHQANFSFKEWVGIDTTQRIVELTMSEDISIKAIFVPELYKSDLVFGPFDVAQSTPISLNNGLVTNAKMKADYTGNLKFFMKANTREFPNDGLIEGDTPSEGKIITENTKVEVLNRKELLSGNFAISIIFKLTGNKPNREEVLLDFGEGQCKLYAINSNGYLAYVDNHTEDNIETDIQLERNKEYHLIVRGSGYHSVRFDIDNQSYVSTEYWGYAGPPNTVTLGGKDEKLRGEISFLELYDRGIYNESDVKLMFERGKTYTGIVPNCKLRFLFDEEDTELVHDHSPIWEEVGLGKDHFFMNTSQTLKWKIENGEGNARVKKLQIDMETQPVYPEPMG